MYVLKTYKTKKIKLDDGSEPQKTTFEKIVFCNNKKELDQFLKGSISTIACWFGKNELYTTICELENLDLKPFFKWSYYLQYGKLKRQNSRFSRDRNSV